MEIEFDKYKKHGAYHWKWYAEKQTYIEHVHKIKSWIKESNVLDVGAGDGLIAHTVGMKGIDNNPIGVKLAQEKGIDVILGSAYELPFKDEEFDAVFMGDTLEHLEFPEKALKEARRVLKKYFYTATPIKECRKDIYQYEEWSQEELKTLVEKVGFILEEPMTIGGMRGCRKAYCKFKKI